ncbi:hypothetical protein Cgig2_012727 [Carnegiea gigantea]|uniref:SGNH hydrolase-type esterase domain-containing protein n=1 Tax=Carnegiea gigantea TaxID=171969 RepID=A0A9Q1KA64_9CARY|nr:hypothetical protein Cgig2_012727 [Carnegiea gigantea]
MGAVRPQIILFGDSITEQSFRPGGWGAALADNYSRKADILNRGYGGYTTRWALFLLHHIFPLLHLGAEYEIDGQPTLGNGKYKPRNSNAYIPDGLAKPPVAVTIFFGANDAALPGRNSDRQHVPIKEYTENLRKIVEHLKKCSLTMLVVLITPPPVDEEGRMEYARSVYGDEAMKEPERTNETAAIYAKQCVAVAEELGIPFINLWSKMQETEGWQRKFLSDGLHLTPEGNAVVHKEVIRVFNKAGLVASEMPYDFPHHSEIDSKNPEKAFTIKCS